MTPEVKILLWTLQNAPQQLYIVNARQILVDCARQNHKRPASFTVAVPDELVKGLKGQEAKGDTVLIIRIPREARERSESRIILPGEVRQQ